MKYLFIALFLMIATDVVAQGDTSWTYHHPLPDFSYEKMPFKLVDEQAKNTNRKLRFSVLTGYREGVKQVVGMVNFNRYDDKETGTSRLYMYNLSIVQMLTHGWYYPCDVVLEVKDPSHYLYNPSQGDEEKWLRKNGYCFELTLPTGTTRLETFDQEIARALGVSFHTEKRPMKTLLLVRTSKAEKFKYTGPPLKRGIIDEKTGRFTYYTLNTLADLLNHRCPIHISNETGNDLINTWIDIEFGAINWNDIPALRKALQRYDLDLKEETITRDVDVVRELNYKIN